VSAEEFLASPQFVNDKAYLTLQANLPAPLPFHQPSSLRRYFAKFHVRSKRQWSAAHGDAVERANDSPTAGATF